MKSSRRRFSINLSAITILSVTAAATAAVTVCIAIFASVYSRALMKDAQVNSEQSVQQTTVSVNNYLSSMKSRLSEIKDMVIDSETAEEFSRKIAPLTQIQNDIYAVTIYGSQGEILCSNGGNTLKDQIYQNLSFDREGFESADDFALSKPHVQTMFEGEYPWVVTLAVKTDREVFGGGKYIAIDFSFSEIAKYIDHVGIGRHGYCFVIDNVGNIVYHPQQQLLFSGIKFENSEYISSLSDGVHIEKNLIYTLNTTEDNRWRIVGVNYTDELAAERRTQIIISVCITFFCSAIIALFVLLVYSRIVNNPLKRLMNAMYAFENEAERFRFEGETEAVTELQALSDSFQHMTEKIRDLMEKVRKEESEVRKTELKALQAQINPHFLYNTLDSIQWMCERGKNEDAIKMVGALARLFRISISRGHELITIKEEIQHAESYLVIQSYRYKDQFSYRFDVQEGLEGYLCNKITIQPLIENAIYHGIDRMVDVGRIDITVKEADDNPQDILIVVSDNGVGMTEEQCRKILQKDRSDSGGIGVKNVNDRLVIYFGEDYGLTIQSELDVGTTVTVRIPKIKGEAQNEI